METFVIRVWTPAEQEDEGQPRNLRGLIEHVRFDERCTFEDGNQLLAVLQTALERQPPAATTR